MEQHQISTLALAHNISCPADQHCPCFPTPVLKKKCGWVGETTATPVKSQVVLTNTVGTTTQSAKLDINQSKHMTNHHAPGGPNNLKTGNPEHRRA